MALNDIKVPKENAQGTFDEIALAPADIGAAASSHTHAASAIVSGTLNIARIPTGTGSTQVALGNHTHTLSAISDAGTAAAQDADQDLGTGDAVTFEAVNVVGAPVLGYPGEGVLSASTINLDTHTIDTGGGVPGDGFGKIVFGASDATTMTISGPSGGLGTSKNLSFPNASGTVALTSDIKITSNPTGITGADAVTNIVSLTTAEYAAIGSPDAATLYLITDP